MRLHSAFGRRAVAERQRAEGQARLVTSRELTAAAVDNLEIDPERSKLLAIQAISEAGTLDAENALHRAIQASRLRLTLSGHDSDVVDVAFNADGTHLATAAMGGALKVWDTATGQELFNQGGKNIFANRVAISPDWGHLAETQIGGPIEVRDLAPVPRCSYSPARLTPPNPPGIWPSARMGGAWRRPGMMGR